MVLYMDKWLGGIVLFSCFDVLMNVLKTDSFCMCMNDSFVLSLCQTTENCNYCHDSLLRSQFSFEAYYPRTIKVWKQLIFFTPPFSYRSRGAQTCGGVCRGWIYSLSSLLIKGGGRGGGGTRGYRAPGAGDVAYGLTWNIEFLLLLHFFINNILFFRHSKVICSFRFLFPFCKAFSLGKNAIQMYHHHYYHHRYVLLDGVTFPDSTGVTFSSIVNRGTRMGLHVFGTLRVRKSFAQKSG